MRYTSHASARLQQRAIPVHIVDLLEKFGSSMRAHRADRLFFDKAARRRLARNMGGKRGLQSIERWMNVYIVVSDDGQVITAARQTARHRRR